MRLLNRPRPRRRKGVLSGIRARSNNAASKLDPLSLLTAVANMLFRGRGRRRVRGRRFHARISWLGPLATLMFLAGCAVGPNFHRPDPPPVNGYTPEPLAHRTSGAKVSAGESQRFVEGLDIPGQ